MNPPWNRKLLLSKLEEEIITSDEKHQLSTNQYPGVVHPKGYKYLNQFRLDPFPTFLYSLPKFSLRKRIFTPPETNAVVVNYKILDKIEEATRIRLRPLVNFRGINEIMKKEQEDSEFWQEKKSKKVQIFNTSSDSPILLMGSDLLNYRESDLSEQDRWFEDMEYLREKERGYEYHEDHYNPGFFEIELTENQPEFNFLAAGGSGLEKTFSKNYSEKPKDFEQKYTQAVERLRSLPKKSKISFSEEGDYWRSLILAADSFIVRKKMIIAGYHWFTTWGRDSLIALPGLTLVTGRNNIAKNILLTFADRQKNGIIPNRFGDGWEEFNNVDGSLLFFYALYKYLTYTNDLPVAEELWNTLVEIIQNFTQGIGEKVKMEKDGLLQVCEGMTWMDARVDKQCVTPREGKPVEINALWYNALKIMNIIAEKLGKEKKWTNRLEKVRKSFQEKFWNPERECLHDLVKSDYRDESLRPNQLFAISLPFSLFEEEKASKILKTVRDELLTPCGIRTLGKGEPGYRGKYGGNVENCDLSYHQGTVWPWLFGPFVTALTRYGVEGSGGVKEYGEDLVESFLENHLEQAGLGSVSEVFDGDEPHESGGCVSQAWSVSEILRCYVEDIQEIRPSFEEEYR